MDTEERIRAAWRGAIAAKGAYRGWLKRQCPRAGTDAAIFWQAAMLAVNPYKVSIGACMFMTPEQVVFRDACERFIERDMHSLNRRNLDKDRAGLEGLGVW